METPYSVKALGERQTLKAIKWVEEHFDPAVPVDQNWHPQVRYEWLKRLMWYAEAEARRTREQLEAMTPADEDDDDE